jgi:hypothetical protein
VAEAFEKLELVFYSPEVALRGQIVGGGVRLVVRLGHAEIGQYLSTVALTGQQRQRSRVKVAGCRFNAAADRLKSLCQSTPKLYWP